jgi:hypothetical protein
MDIVLVVYFLSTWAAGRDFRTYIGALAAQCSPLKPLHALGNVFAQS